MLLTCQGSEAVTCVCGCRFQPFAQCTQNVSVSPTNFQSFNVTGGVLQGGTYHIIELRCITVSINFVILILNSACEFRRNAAAGTLQNQTQQKESG